MYFSFVRISYTFATNNRKYMILTTTFPDKVFASQVPDVELTTEATRVHVVMLFGGTAIYDENLYPDDDKAVTIGEMGALVLPFSRQSLVAALKITLTEQTVTTDSDGGETVTEGTELTLETTVVYCAAEVEETADAFCEAHFLSRLQGAKLTAAGRLEYLHYDGTAEAAVTAYYADGSSAAFTATKVGGNGDYSTVDVSAANFVTDGKRLCRYVVSAGGREQTYDIDFTAPDCAPVLLFTNSFGCQELVYCAGEHKVNPEFKRSNTYVKGELRDYTIEETRTFEADTGVLTFPMADWLSDLFRSDEIYLVDFINGQPVVGRKVVITDQKAEYGNADDEMPRFTFSYRYARRNQNVIDMRRGGRIFDNTFDFTFN